MTVNGEKFDFSTIEAEPVVAALVRQLGLSPERVAVELNGELLRRTAYAATKLTDNDTLEIIHYVGGG